MSAVFPDSGHAALKRKPSGWSCFKAMAVVASGAAFWAGVVIVVMRATGA